MLAHPVVKHRSAEDCRAGGCERCNCGPGDGTMRGRGANKKNERWHPPVEPLENSVCSTCTGFSVFTNSMERNSCFGWRTWYRISRKQAMLLAREEKEFHRGSQEQAPFITSEASDTDERAKNSDRLEFVQVLIGKSRMLEEDGHLPVLISNGIDLTFQADGGEEKMDVPQQPGNVKQQLVTQSIATAKRLQQGSGEEKGLDFENVREVSGNLCRRQLRVASEYARNFPLCFPGVVVNIAKNLGRAPTGYIPFVKRWYRYIYTGGRPPAE